LTQAEAADHYERHGRPKSKTPAGQEIEAELLAERYTRIFGGTK
jgi:hypothetical protein